MALGPDNMVAIATYPLTPNIPRLILGKSWKANFHEASIILKIILIKN